MAVTRLKVELRIAIEDGLGFIDVAPYGGEIHTPNLEKLVKEGVRVTNFHTASASSPTISMCFLGLIITQQALICYLSTTLLSLHACAYIL